MDADFDADVDRELDSDDPEDYNYNDPDYDLDEKLVAEKPHPEDFQYKEMKTSEVECFLNECVESLCKKINIPPSIARLLLHSHRWNVENVKKEFLTHPIAILINQKILPGLNMSLTASDSRAVMATIQTAQKLGFKADLFVTPPILNADSICQICFCSPSTPSVSPVSSKVDIFPQMNFKPNLPHSHDHQICESSKYGDCRCTNNDLPNENYFTYDTHDYVGLYGLSCGHRYCLDCWRSYLSVQIDDGLSIEIKCMSSDCNILVVEDFLLAVLTGSPIKDKYFELIFRRMVESHPLLQFCRGTNCPVVICALEEPKARRVKCSRCLEEFCFVCGQEYHAPTSCDSLKQWLVKYRDDSGTANYIAAHTKDCPACHVCIEKNEGCNHMRCTRCNYDFCWVCLGDWSLHKAEYYLCSRYQDNPDSTKESIRIRARESLERYVFYYERWDNHDRSLRLEQQQRDRIRARIHQKVMQKEGTWIDWQYLLTAADTLRNCRYTLKYTYPYAFYRTNLERKELFEYQQALLEAEVEDLSWKIEHAEITDRADLQNKMDICEKHRLTLLQEFLTN